MTTGIVSALVAVARQARKDRGISSEEMAVVLKLSGAGSNSKVSRFENNAHYQELDRVLAVYAAKMELSLFDLLDLAKKELNESAAEKTKMPRRKSARGAPKRAVAAAKKASKKPRP